MSEQERAQAIKSLQLELFEMKRVYLLKAKQLKREINQIASKGMKVCRLCRLEMDVEQFYRRKDTLDQRDSWCIECRKAKQKAA